MKDALHGILTDESVTVDANMPEFQVILKSNERMQSIRSLTAEHINKLIKVLILYSQMVLDDYHNIISIYFHRFQES